MIVVGVEGGIYSETIASGNGEAIVVAPVKSAHQRKTTCTIITAGNSGKVQFTTSGISAVSGGTATWQDWPSGAVIATTSDTLIGPVTAVRGVSVSGEITVEFVI